MNLGMMIPHFSRMAGKAMWRFKMHTVVSQLSLIFGFICFIAAALLNNYVDDFDQHFPNSERIFNLVMVDIADSPMPDSFPIVNEPAARYLRAAFPEIPNIAQASMAFPQDYAIDGVSHVLSSKYVEERFFDIFPLETIAGIDTGEALPPNGVLITDEAAERVFGTTDVLGQQMRLSNSVDVTIAGIARMPDSPTHLKAAISLFDVDVFVPIEIQQRETRARIAADGGDPDADRWGNQSHYVHIEIPEDLPFTVADFNQQLDEFVQRTLPEERREYMTYGLLPVNKVVTNTLSSLTGGFDVTNVLVFAGALVLLIGCLNYSNLVIAQLSLRSQEIGVQKILGSKRSLLILQYCFESLLFVGLAILISMVLFLFLLASFDASGMLGVGPHMLLNPMLWLQIGSVVLLIVLIAGAYPALRTATVPLVTMMRPKGSSGYSGRMRSLMVGFQFFISGTLMILAIVMF
ncbi:MAG: FtsX-like permease family protein, partial [Gammaproteobacteria bacterium]